MSKHTNVAIQRMLERMRQDAYLSLECAEQISYAFLRADTDIEDDEDALTETVVYMYEQALDALSECGERAL